MQDHIQTITTLTTDLLEKMGFESRVEVSEEGDGYLAQIDTQQTGMLIGYHGQTLASLQMLVSQMVQHSLGEWVRLTLNISDYWENRKAQLESMAANAAAGVVESKKPYTLPYLNARERRLVHMALQGTQGVRTESVGEGEQRRLVVFPSHDESN